MTEPASTPPECIGIILDGNRRWARERGLPTLEGHRAGYNKLKDFTLWARDAGVRHVIAYVFSTENWNRTTEEVNYLMDLNRLLLKRNQAWANMEGIRIRVLGTTDRLANDMVTSVRAIEEETANNKRITLALALNYGGRAEIVAAARALAERGEEITESSLASALWSHDIPEPDLIIRTSGEQRLSNFMMWKSAYSELLFLEKNFPDIEREDLEGAIRYYQERSRRFGR